VILLKDEDGSEKLDFEYLDGPITPKPEKIPDASPRGKRRGGSARRGKPSGPKDEGGGGQSSGGRSSVPKVPLVKV
jgi:ATP-dependent Clp protease ATP-binding subunit ClpA